MSDETDGNPEERELCTAHNNPRPCRACRIAEIEFMAEIAQEKRLEDARDILSEQRAQRARDEEGA